MFSCNAINEEMKAYYFIRRSCFLTGLGAGEMLFFGRQWLCLMIIHFKDLHKAVRVLHKSAELSRGSPFLTALLPSDPHTPLGILSQQGTEGSCH